MPTGLLFDFDGVIADSEPLHCAALIATLRDAGLALDEPTYYAEYLGFDDRGCFRHAFASAGRPLADADLPALIRAKNGVFEAMVHDRLVLIPGAADFVRAARDDGHCLAIVSGALRSEIELGLAAAGLRGHFAGIVSAEDVAACKPDPEGYRRGLALLGLPADACIVLEDSLPGLAAARAAGLRCAMVATSHAAEHLAAADLVWTDFTGHTPAELIDAVAAR